MKRWIAAGIAAAAAASMGAGAMADGVDGAPVQRRAEAPAPQPQGDIYLAIDTAVPLRLPVAAGGIVLANPGVAGVSVQNETLLFVTARSYGTTSLTIVDQDGQTIYNGRVIVTPSETDSVMVTRGMETNRFICTPVCRPQPDIGDGQSGFGQALGQASARAGAAR